MNRNKYFPTGNTPAIVAIVVVLILGAIAFYFMYNKTATPTSPTPPAALDETRLNDDEGGTADDEGAGTSSAMPVLDGTEPVDEMIVVDQNVRTVEMSAKNFEFSQKEIRVKKGETVKVVLTSESGFHDWVVDQFDARTSQINTGATSEVTFVADEAGTFEFYCSVGSHRQMGMKGNLIVE